MSQQAKLLAYSQGPFQKPLATLECRYPKFIHAEALTHRILEIQPNLHVSLMVPDGLMYDQNLSRNASSSRAIPVKRLIEDVLSDPVIPMVFGKNQSGMAARQNFEGAEAQEAKRLWLQARDAAVLHAQKLSDFGVHKQIVNRIIEPFCHIKVVITGTEWNNFFGLRMHKDAQPEICDLATQMYDLMQRRQPKPLAMGEWHLPYIEDYDWDKADEYARKDRITRDIPQHTELLEIVKKVSVARCARTSYNNFEGKISTIEEDIKLYDFLVVAVPLHASPAEHQATPDILFQSYVCNSPSWNEPSKHGNLMGYLQLRKLLPNECIPG